MVSFFTGDPQLIKNWVTQPQNQGIEVFWWPLNSAVTLKTWNSQNDKIYYRLFRDYPDQSVKPQTVWGDFSDSIISVIQKIQINLGKTLANLALIPCGILNIFYARAATALLAKGSKTASRSGAIHYQKHIGDWVINDIEVCIKLTPDWSNLPKIIQTTVNVTEQWIKSKKTNPVNVAMEWRLTRGCPSALMSPAFTNDPDDWYIWIEVLASANFPNWWNDFALQMRQAWYDLDHTQKPHWCKWWDPPGTNNQWNSQVKSAYSNELLIFKEEVNKLDPNHVFRTKFWDDLLQ